MKATNVSVTGPESAGIDPRSGIETPEWYVCAADDDGEPIGKVYRCSTFESATSLGAHMARDRRLELVDEAMSA